MPRIKVQLADNIKRVVTLDTDATKGATLGTNLFLPNGQIGTPASVRAWLGGAVSGGVVNSTPISLSNILTTKGDLVTRDTQVQRLPIGAQDSALRVSAGGLAEWRAGAGLTVQSDTNIQLSVTSGAAASLLAAAEITAAWSGVLAVNRGGTGFDEYEIGDLLVASGPATLEQLAAGPDGWVLTMHYGMPEWMPASEGDTAATYLTAEDEADFLPNSRRLVAGTNVTFDDSVANTRTINASGGGGSSGYPEALGYAGIF